MSPVEDDALAVLQRAVDYQRRVGDHRAQPLGVALVALEHACQLEWLHTVDTLEPDVLLCERDLDLLREDLRVEQVLDADPEPVRLVRVRRADPAVGCPDLQLPQAALTRLVDERMPRHDQVRVPREPDELGGDATRLEVVQLIDHDLRVDHAAGADDALLAADDPGGDVLELVGLAVGHDGVAGVGTAVVAADEVGVLRQQVDDLPLPFVAPLRADDHGRWHVPQCALCGGRSGPGSRVAACGAAKRGARRCGGRGGSA